MKKKLIAAVLALTLALGLAGTASAETGKAKKTTVGTPKITYVGCGFYDYETAGNLTTEKPFGIHSLTIDWTAVKGATGYQQQINYKRGGKWSGWKAYYYDKDRNFTSADEGQSGRCYFNNYQTRLKDAKAELKRNAKSYTKKGYIWRAVKDKNGETTPKKYTFKQYMKKFVPKTRANIAVWQDDTVYKFRVRAYKTVNGKKIYGKWSQAVTAKEKITKDNIDEVFNAIQENVKAWAKVNYPNFVVADERTGAWDEEKGEYPGYTPEGGTYYIIGSQRDYLSRYASPEAVIQRLTKSYEDYIEDVTAGGGNESAYLFIRKMKKGSQEGLGSAYDRTKIFYKTWILVCY